MDARPSLGTIGSCGMQDLSPSIQNIPDSVRLQAVLDACHEGIITLDQEGRVVSCNPSAERMLGFELAHVLGRPSVDPELFTAVDEQGRPFPEDAHPSRLVLHTGRPCLGVIQGLQSPRGLARWIQINAVPLRLDAGGPLSGVVVSLTDITERKVLEGRLREEATHDELTGLSNRRHFMEQLQRSVGSARRHHHALVLCVADLDHFKLINDTHGHGSGDRALQAFSGLLAAQVRKEDMAARIGGDEFALLFHHASLEAAQVVVTRIQASMDVCEVLNDEGIPFALSGSFGMARFLHGEMDPGELLSAADEALYQAKHAGRHCVAIHS